MPCAIPDPCLRRAVGQVHSHEDAAEIVHADRLSHVAAFEELGPIDTGELQVSAEPFGHVLHVHVRAAMIQEEARPRRRVASQGAPRLQRPHHVSPEAPRAWHRCLICVEAHSAAIEIHIGEGEPRGLARPHPLASEKPVEDPER